MRKNKLGLVLGGTCAFGTAFAVSKVFFEKEIKKIDRFPEKTKKRKKWKKKKGGTSDISDEELYEDSGITIDDLENNK